MLTLKKTFKLLFTTLSLVVLASCGGGGGGGVATAKGMASGSVVLPAGFTLPMSQLAVSTDGGQVPLSSKGTFSAPVSSTGPRMVQLVDTVSDKIVMLGFVDSASSGSSYSRGKGQISAATTAAALLFVGAEGPFLPADNWQDFQSSIVSSTQVGQVASVVTSSIVANPTAISDGDTAIENAVGAVQASEQAIIQRAFQRSSRVAVNRVTVVRQNSSSGSSGTLITVSPGDNTAQSGLVVEPNSKGEGIVFVNGYRRRSAVFIYEVATGQTANSTTPLSSPIEIVAGQAISPEIALSSTKDTFENGLQGQFSFLPEPSGPINLTPDGSNPVTVYAVVVVGPGGTNTLSTAAAAMWPSSTTEQAALTSEWTKSVALTSVRSLVQDVVIPFFSSFIMGSSEAKAVDNDALQTDVENLANSLSDVSAAIQAGNYKLAATSFINDVLTQPNAKDAFLQLLQNAIVKAGFITSANLTKVLARFAAAGTVQGVIDKSFVAIDIARVFADTLLSNTADNWTATVLPAKVSLSPNQGIVNTENNIATFTVGVVGVNDLTGYTFQWSTTGTMGALEEPNSSTSMPSGQTSFSSAAYIANLKELSSGKTDTVTVKVFDNDGSQIGSASSTVIDQDGQENEIPVMMSGVSFPSPGPGYGTVWTEGDVVSFPLVKGATKYAINLINSSGGYVGMWSYNVADGFVTSNGLNGPVKYLPVQISQAGVSICYDGADEAELTSTEQQIQLTTMQKGVAGIYAAVVYQ